MRRRDLLSLLGGAAVSWPMRARAQQSQRMRLVGVMTNLAEDDPETKRRLDAFKQHLQELGWQEQDNIRFAYRWGVGDPDKHHRNAADLVALNADVILAHGNTIMVALRLATATIPIVFVSLADPVAGGFVASLSHPGGNATGFTSFEYAQSGKWVELLKELAPNVQRVAVVRDPKQVSCGGQIAAIQAGAVPLRIEVVPSGMRDRLDIQRTLERFASRPDGGLIVTTAAWAQIHRYELVALAATFRLPAMYPYRLFTSVGGLCCYAPDIVQQYKEAAGYVDRILRGEKPADLPVQAPTRYELVINLKTARALGLDVPPTLLAQADEVIE